MAYFDADMDDEQMPIIDRMDKEYKIYANNLPQELNEDAIKEIFGQYGQITGIFHPRNATWSYISYGSYREAELAIRELNDKRPLYLQVALAKEMYNRKKEELLEVSQERPAVANAVTEPMFTDRNSRMKLQQNVGRGRAARTDFTMQHTALMRKSIENGSSQSVSSPSSQISNAYENEEHFVSTNRLWTRGLITITADGRRHVSLGRGYTMYELPEMNPKIEDYITKVHEQRNRGLYEYGEDKLKTGLQKCLVCSNKTTKHCEKCHTYYCSKTCQITDWPRHQAECERIPALVEEIDHDVSLLEINKDRDVSKPNISNKIASDNVKLRRPNMSMQVEDSKSTNIHSSVNKNTDATCDSTKDKCIDNQDRYPSVPCGDNINVPQTRKPDQSPINTVNTRNLSQQSRLHRYNINENTDQPKRNDEHSSPTSNSTHQSNAHNQNGAISKNAGGFNKELIKIKNANVRSKFSYPDGTRHDQKNGFQNDRKSASYNDEEIPNKQESRTSISNMASGEDMSFHKDTYLSITEFINVEIIIALGNDEYWIYKVQDTDARIDIMTKLQDVAAKAHNVQPIIGGIYGALFETIWHRVMVTALNPVKVNFIDFGNYEVLERNADIKDIGNLVKPLQFARKIRLMQTTSKKYNNLSEGDQISVKMLSINPDKTIVVKVQEQSESSVQCTTKSISSMSDANNSTKSVLQEKLMSLNTNAPSTNTSKIQLPSILDALFDLLTKKAVPELKIAGVIQIFGSMEKDIYSATLCPQDFTSNMESIFNDLPVECTKMEEHADYKPQVGDLICGETKNGGEWYRGYVSTTSPDLHIAAVDEARILSVHKALPYPKKFLNVCTFGVMCNMTTAELKVGTVYSFTATMNKQDHEQQSFKVEMTENDETITAVIKPWKPITKSVIPAFPKLRNRAKVCLTSYRNQCIMFARSLDEEEIEYYNRIMQRVAQCALTAPLLSKSSDINKQMVIAPFSDGNSYRAMVTKNENDKATVVYVDFGNFDDINVNELRVLPDDLGMQRSCSARINLKDVPRDVPMTQEVDDYLRDLVGKEVPLTCVYEEGLLKEGVHLMTSTGESVNDTIKKLLTPGWKRENYDDKTCYMLNDMEIASLGSVNDTVNALVLYIQQDMTCMMGPCDMDLITHTSEVMPTLVQEYCEKMEYYIPRAKELCLALYEGGWYRALCLNPTQSQTTCQIFFIDYGNVEFVEHKNVRMMPKDFITPAAMANMCTVVNLAPVDNMGNYSPDIKQKITELVRPHTLIKIKIIERVDAGEYKIELPEIRATLIEQGFISNKA